MITSGSNISRVQVALPEELGARGAISEGAKAMRRCLQYLLPLSGLLLVVVGVLVSHPAQAQPAPAAPSGAAPFVPALSPTPSCTPGWTIYPNPAPPGDSVLNGITALAPNDLWAVGAYTSTGTTLTVHGDGTS